MEIENQANEKINRLFKSPGNRQNFELFIKFLSIPSTGLSLCRVMPEERLKILSFFKSDPMNERIHVINMINPPRGTMELQQTIIDAYEKFESKKNIFFIYNLESCIYLLKSSADEFFQGLNLIRDFFMHFNGVFVFFVTGSSIKTMIQNAFDFYDWINFTFTFVPEKEDSTFRFIETGEHEEIKYSNPHKKVQYLKNSINKIKNEKEKSLHLLELGTLYRQIGHYGDALKALSEALEIEEKSGSPGSSAKIYHVTGLVHKDKEEPDKALEFISKASEIFEKNNNRVGLAITYDDTGRVYRDKGALDKALEYAIKASDIFNQEKDLKNLAISYTNIERVYRNQGNFDKAREYGLLAMEYFAGADDTENLAKTYNNTGLVYQAQGKMDKALEFVFKALAIFEKMDDRENIETVQANIGKIYLSMGEEESAKKYIQNFEQITPP